MSAKTLPAYLRLPDGLRLAGAASIDKDGLLIFSPKQAMTQVPPTGLPVELVIVGLPDDIDAAEDAGDGETADTQIKVSGSIDIVNARQVGIIPDASLPPDLKRFLSPQSAAGAPQVAPATGPLGEMQREGVDMLSRSIRRFVIALGDHLFDLSTSTRYGSAGRHSHYDALNQLKRSSAELTNRFGSELMEALQNPDTDAESSDVADLEHTSPQSLGLVGLEEINLKLAGDKIVGRLRDQFRVELESLTIRAALLQDIDPHSAPTPFHPAQVLRAFLDSFGSITDNADVIADVVKFFGEKFFTEFRSLYTTLNQRLADAGIEPDLEERIRNSGSLLNPPEKRIVKSPDRDVPAEADPATESGDDDEPWNDRAEGHSQRRPAGERDSRPGGSGDYLAEDAPAAGQGTDTGNYRPAPTGAPAAGEGADTGNYRPAPTGDPAPGDSGAAPAGPARSAKHDAIYDAVLAALDYQRGRSGVAGVPAAAAGPGEASFSRRASDNRDATAGRDRAAGDAPAAGAPAGGAPPPGPGSAAEGMPAAAPLRTLGAEEIAASLRTLQSSQPAGDSLADLPPLTSLLSQSASGDGGAVEVERDTANRLDFIDNVFATLDKNFEVSADMAPSIAQLRVPLARLSMQEPKFFTQPEHPAHRLLDKLSMLASSDRTVNRSLQKRVADIVDRVARDYDGDSEVFASAQQELDGLLQQQNQTLNKNVQRVISALEGQEKLNRAQRRVEKMVTETVPGDATPAPVQELLDSGWRSALVQLALREGEDSLVWREEVALLEKLVTDIQQSADGALPEREKQEMQVRLRALGKRLGALNPGATAHETAMRRASAVLDGASAPTLQPYRPPSDIPTPLARDKVEQLPRLRRWIKRTEDLDPGAKLRYVDKDGRRRQMELVWVNEERNRFVFINERGQKIAELTAIQLARQLSRGATPPTSVDRMSVLDQSMYNTLESAQRTLSFERNRDQLTRLVNRESLVNQLDRTLGHAQRRGAQHAFGLLDIDNFALVNEVFDDTSGDEVLAEFARLLSQLNDRRALAARMEEDEFGILLTYRSASEAREIADKIRQDIAGSSLDVGGERVSFTVSVGITPVEQTTVSVEAVLAHARSALDLAKSQGRDQVVVYNPDQQELIDYRLDREASRQRLDEAMSTDRLVLRAQPIVQTTMDGSVSASHHYEILLSLRDDDGNLLSPQEFISSAERFGFINMVDRWVVREVFTWISSLVDKQKVVPELSINLSGSSITDNDFLDYILEQISEFGVGTSRLCFEITETGAIDNLPRAADFVRTLKNLGCKFSLDDFGTGLASHNYLRELPVDYVKIDGTFISNIHNSETDYAMAKSINDLAHFLGQQTVAECVETLENIPALREIGVDFLQGWGVGMPARLEEVTEDLPALET